MATVPLGSLAFPFNGPYGNAIPIVYLSSVDGSLITVDDPILGENADVLDSGVFTTAFDKNYSYCPVQELADWSAVVRLGNKTPRGNYLDRFYVQGVYADAGGSALVIQAVDVAGALVDTWELGHLVGSGGFDITGLNALAADEANTVAYFALAQGDNATLAQTQVVYAWDLVNDVALPDFATDPDRRVTRSGYGLLVLRNGEVLVGWDGRSVASTEIRHYSAAGALLHTYVLNGAASTDTLILESALDDLSVWVGWYDAADYYRVQQIQISDGAVLADIEITTAFKDAIDLANSVEFNPDLGFFLTRTACPVTPPPPGGRAGCVVSL